MAESESVIESVKDVTLARVQNDADNDTSTTQILGVGELLITSQQVKWIPVSDDIEKVEFPSSDLIMHALSREGNPPDFVRPCIYCQVDESLGLELYFAPADSGDLERCFRAFSHTCMLNPPESESEMPEDGPTDFNGFYGEVDDSLVMSFEETNSNNNGVTQNDHDAMLAHLDSILQVPPHLVRNGTERGQFEDSHTNGGTQ
mmetsp:Transcript_9654/g.12677  ORF Transcript_9654/g.12677 Transcript_9654/m.12677 type:complete len:203 (+) Transcript_9654:19-627(+)